MKIKANISRRNVAGALGGVLALLLLVSIVLAQISIYGAEDEIAAMSRADAAVQQVAAQLYQQTEEGFRLLELAGKSITGNIEQDKYLLTALEQQAVFDTVVLATNGMIYASDGSVYSAENPTVYIQHKTDELSGKVFVGDDGSVQLRMMIGSNLELLGFLDINRIESIFSSAFEEDYGYAVYNAATGAYVINCSGFAENRYYDTLLELNAGGRAGKLMHSQRAQAYIDSNNPTGKAFYIAHMSIGIQPWSIALFIPASILESNADATRILPAVSVALAAVLAVIFVFQTAYFLRRLRLERVKRAESMRISSALLGYISRNTGFTVYVYSRSEDRIVEFFEGLGCAAVGMAVNSIPALGAAYGLDVEACGRLYERIRELKPGEQLEMDLECSAISEERTLRFEMGGPAQDGEWMIGSVRDCKLETERANQMEAEEQYRRSMRSKTSAIWQINVSRNIWRLIDGKPTTDIGMGNVNIRQWVDYSATLGNIVHNYIHPADQEGYFELTSPEGIGAMLREGKTEARLEYRVKSNGEGYEWHRAVLRIYRSAKEADLMANMYILNVNAVKIAELERRERAQVLQKSLTALGGAYNGLYYVELDEDLCYTARAFGGELTTKLCQPYKAAFDSYVARNVHPDDQAALRKLLEPYNLRKSMTEASHLLRCEYRRQIGDRYEASAIIVQAARFENGTIRDVVIAMSKPDYGQKVQI